MQGAGRERESLEPLNVVNTSGGKQQLYHGLISVEVRVSPTAEHIIASYAEIAPLDGLH